MKAERQRRRVARCSRCGQREAVWAWQIVGGESTLTTLGSHYRGFPVHKLCAQCAVELRQREIANVRSERLAADLVAEDGA